MVTALPWSSALGATEGAAVRPGSHPPSGDGQGFGNGCEGAGASTNKLHITCFSFFLSFLISIFKIFCMWSVSSAQRCR